jgi:predicted nucleic acid-binding protein
MSAHSETANVCSRCQSVGGSSSGDPRRILVLRQISEWLDDGVELHAPFLAQYEFANALTRLVVTGSFPSDRIEEAVNSILVLPIHYHPIANIARVTAIAQILGRQSAYDAAYVELAESLDVELWTLDGPLYRNAIDYGFAVRLIQ